MREGQQGSIAKRWSRRTGAQVEGKIESRGVGLVYPVGGEPGAQAKIARCNPQGKQREQVKRGSKRELLAETNETNITSGLLFHSATASHVAAPLSSPLSRISAHRSLVAGDAIWSRLLFW